MPPLRTAAEPPRYPARRFKPSALFGFQAQAAFEALQLKTAIDYFLSLLAQAAPPLDPETKTALIPMLSALVGLGWPRDAALDILYAVPHDTKSCARADMAFKSIGDFVRRCGTAQADALHIALHDIGVILRDASRKYDPNQPRVPAGNGDGGQWTDGGGGTPARIAPPRCKPAQKPVLLPRRKPAPRHKPPVLTDADIAVINSRAPAGLPPEELEVDPAFGLPRWVVSGVAAPTVSPLDLVGGAGTAIGKTTRHLATTTVSEAVAAVRVLRARSLGKKIPEEAYEKVRRAADAVEEFLGGRPDRAIFKKSGDMTLIKGDTAVRFDIVKYGSKKTDRPHFQIQKRISPQGARKEKWKDLGQHWYDFLDSAKFMKD